MYAGTMPGMKHGDILGHEISTSLSSDMSFFSLNYHAYFPTHELNCPPTFRTCIAVGIVEDVGPEVRSLSRGDRVVVAFDIACGSCFYCKRSVFSSCDSTNPSKEQEVMYGHHTAGMFGYSHLTGGWDGGQAEWVRVPYGTLC
jgi:threonine dehydrogenase-like Zn-dependent dehydrogenase